MPYFALPFTTADLDHQGEGQLLGRALMAGRLRVTMRSLKSGQHVSIEFKGKRPGSSQIAPLDEAAHVYIDVPRGLAVGRLDLTRQRVWLDHDPARDPHSWTAMRLLRIALGRAPMSTATYSVIMGTHCVRCGAELDEPESIAAFLGPVCADRISETYGRMHARHVGRRRSEPAPRTAAVLDPADQQAVVEHQPSYDGIVVPADLTVLDTSQKLRDALASSDAHL